MVGCFSLSSFHRRLVEPEKNGCCMNSSKGLMKSSKTLGNPNLGSASEEDSLSLSLSLWDLLFSVIWLSPFGISLTVIYLYKTSPREWGLPISRMTKVRSFGSFPRRISRIQNMISLFQFAGSDSWQMVVLADGRPHVGPPLTGGSHVLGINLSFASRFQYQ